MKKIGILNFHDSNFNYGAVLQAVALQESLKQLGYKSENINLIRTHSPLFLLYRKIVKVIKVFLGKDYFVNNSIVFQNFREKYLNVTRATFYKLEDLDAYSFDYSAVIVGSDQVWRPRYTQKLALAYFLSFVKKPIKRIAYAASFGVDHWESTEDAVLTESISKLIKQFDAVSVREDSGVDICKTVFDKKAEHVLDPILLVGKEFFIKMTEKQSTKNKDTLVYCKLDRSQDFMNTIEYIQSQIVVVPINIYKKKKNKLTEEFITINNWVKEIIDSDFVITDSFHCICFAILFNKNFVCYANKNRGLARIESLLKLLGISNRIISKFNTAEIDKLLEDEINYKAVSDRLDTLRISSYHYLKESLK